MNKFEISGCLTSLIILFITYYLIKELWWLIVGIILIIIVAYYSRLIYLTIHNKNKEAQINYKPDMGEVYKVCPYCNTMVKVTDKTCPCCNRALN